MIQNLEQYREKKRLAAIRPATSGANALEVLPVFDLRSQLQIVNTITEFPKTALAPKPGGLPASIPTEITNSAEGWVAPKAGETAKKIQSDGLAKLDRDLAEFERTGIYTPNAVRASYNSFTRMAITTSEGNVLNISGATELPQGIDPLSILERIGKGTLGAEVEAARFGRITIMYADVPTLDYATLFTNLTEATKQVNTEYFPTDKANALNALQDKRTTELLADANRAKGVVEGTVTPDIAALDPSAAQKEYFLWTGKRENGVIKGINPDGDWQDIEELAVSPDAATKGLMNREIALLKEVQEGMIRVIFVGDNEDYVKRCCLSASATQQEMSNSSNQLSESSPQISAEQPLSQQTQVHSGASVPGGGASAYDRESCSSCGENKYDEDGCKCSKS